MINFNTNKQEILIDFYNNDNKIVSIILFDSFSNTIIGSTSKVMSLQKASELYNVVGEVHNGEIIMYDSEYYC